ncbi:MAG: extracellular solute-binding protein [Lachnospiraceae bacterium]|nr:extracellular solute-binding protein [Lachnospiraceae bacterium]
MEKKKLFSCCAVGAAAAYAAAVLLFGHLKDDGLVDRSVQDSVKLAIDNWSQGEAGVELYYDKGGFLLQKDTEWKGSFAVEEGADWEVRIDYAIADEATTEFQMDWTIGQTQYTAQLPILWYDEGGERLVNRYGNELNLQPRMVKDEVGSYLLQKNDVGRRRLILQLEPGTYDFAVTGNHDVRIYGMYLTKSGVLPAEVDTGSKTTGNNIVMIEAENSILKSDSDIRGKNVKNPALTPYETKQNKINVIDASSWSDVGQKILWTAQVDEAGWYRIGFRYSQYSDADKSSYRTLAIDGRYVADREHPVIFESTAMNSYTNLTVSQDGQDCWVYLDKGPHTVSMEAVMDPTLDIYNEILELMDEVNRISMDLRKMSAGSADANRTWDMETYLPEVPSQLEDCRQRIDAVYQKLWDMEGKKPSYASQLLYAVQQLDNILSDIRLIPNKYGLLSEGDGSVNSSLGGVLEKLVKQPLSLDRIYFYQDVELPKASSNLWVRMSESWKRLLYTYLPGAESSDYTAADTNSEELQVWVSMSISYAEVLQQLIDEYFNPVHGTDIQLALMPNSQKLILSNATNSNPDVVLGVGYTTPYDLAIRGAVKNLLEYDDFAEYYQKEYNIAGLTPLAYNGGIYGVVDSFNYQILFYRKDILDSLGLEVPETWDDVEAMMPVLLRYSMNFYSNMASSSSFKDFNMTGPFLYQNGGGFYSEDGATVAFNSKESVTGLREMTELFRVYSLSEYVANFFNSFRYGDIPIGVGNFSTYLQLQTAAPELEGQWGIALVPGERQEDGTVLRAHSANSTASMIFDNTDKPEEAWEFLKWWLSADIQTEFSNRLETTYGDAYRWNTANLTAFENLPYPDEHKAIILEELSYQTETARHPAGYMVEREVSNIWNNVVVNGKGLTESTDRAVIASEREIQRKLKEFGFMDSDGNLIMPYTTEDVREWLNVQKGEE